jgi:hypothetical protein
MGDSRAGVPPGGQGPAERNGKVRNFERGASWREMLERQALGKRLLRRLHLTSLARRRDRWITIPRYQTAELWMIPDLKDPRPRPMSYKCSSCSEKEETRLLSIVLQTAPPWPRRRVSPTAKREARPRILLRVTRSQLDEINAEFAARAQPPQRRPDNRTDREMLLGSLVQ